MEDVSDEHAVSKTFGTVRLHREGTHEIILIPRPSNDPNDPLNWSKAYRYYLAGLTSLTLFFANFMTIGPSVTLVEVAITFFQVIPPSTSNLASLTPSNVAAFQSAISKTSYLYSCSALLQGASNIFWMPLAVKYGRRPIYIASYTLFLASTIWAGTTDSYASELAARILMGFGSGSAECVAPLTISDIFFLHERGRMMSVYTIALAAGGSTGSIVAGLISLRQDWRVIYHVSAGIVGAITLLITVTMPETIFKRTEGQESCANELIEIQVKQKISADHIEAAQQIPKKKTWRQSMSLNNGSQTAESLWLVFVRPALMLLLLPVFWATLVLGLNVGFSVVISSSLASSLSEVYGFDTWQVGLFWLSNLIGIIIGLPFAGTLSDYVANLLTIRNGGIREPEMRLPTMIIGMILIPTSILIYGLGLNYKLHWMVPALGLGIFGFGLVVVGNVTIVYTVDAYRPIAGEVVVSQMGFKAIFAFILGFFVNPWIAASGYAGTFGTMAGITFAVYGFWVPLYFWGKKIRHGTMKWGIANLVKWDNDREVGE